MGLSLSGIEDSGWDQVKFNTSYFVLARGEGKFSQIEMFSASLTYMFTKDGDMDISLIYETGRDYEKFDKRDLLKTSFGYKF